MDGRRSGKYGRFFISIILSYSEGCNNTATAFDINTAI